MQERMEKIEKLLKDHSVLDNGLHLSEKDTESLLAYVAEVTRRSGEQIALREEYQQALEELQTSNEEIRKVNDHLQESELRNREAAAIMDTIFNTIPDVLGIQDDEHNILRYNKAGYDFLNTDEHSVLGKKCYEVIGRVKACDPCATAEAYRTKKPASIERHFPEIDTWLDIRAYPVLDENKNIRFIIEHLRDITQIKKHQEQLAGARRKAEESDRLKSAFLANMSHEIRTPLNAILGFSELLENEDTEPEKQERFIRFIRDSGKQLLRLINDLIDISKIESGQLSINKELINLPSLIQELKGVFLQNKVLKNNPDIQMLYKIPPGSNPQLIYTDPVRLKQILINLMHNAIKFTPQGYIETGYTKEGGHYRFYVKDTGAGIPGERQKSIFERFNKTDSKDTDEGTGLGLSISKGLVHLLEGEIGLSSEAGKGSEFYFFLPAPTDASPGCASTQTTYPPLPT